MQKLPKSPKFFYPQRTSTCKWISRFRRFASSPIFPCICLAFGVFGVIFGSVGISLYGLRKCPGLGLPATLSVAWDGNGGRNKSSEMDVFGENQRHKVMAFVGIQTGFSSVGRRKALRKTWMPSDRDELRRLEESTGLAFRFVIGRSSDRSKMASLEKEIHEYDDFLLIDVEEHYSKLPFKTLAFFKAAYRLYDCDFYVKADDDIYLRPDRLSLLLAKDRSHSQTYLGCMKKGVVFTDPKLKWYEPLSPLLGSEYFLHAYGPIYALSSDTVSNLILVRNDSFRMFSNEDVMIGSWMLAMNVEHEHEKELCQTQCTTSSIAVWDIPKCSGLCHPEQQLIVLHQMDICSNSPTMAFND